MAPLSWTMNLFFVSLLFVAACLAGEAPAGSINFTPRAPHQYQQRGVSEPSYSEDVEVYGPLVPSSSKNQSSMLVARVAEASLYGPLLDVPGCFYCPEPEVTAKSGRALLAELTTVKMKSYMRISNTAMLKNKCVFYSAAWTKPPQYLSQGATDWACKHNKFTIWNLWPNKLMAANPKYKDFYGINEETNWLHSISQLEMSLKDKKVPPVIQYFENMSEAMAQSCSGEVVIMTQTTGLMGLYHTYENIWKNKERPALMNLRDQGKIDRFLIVDYNNPDMIWEFDIDSVQRGKRVQVSDLKSRDLDEEESEEMKQFRREVCDTSGLGQMPPQGDPFSDNYNLFEPGK